MESHFIYFLYAPSSDIYYVGQSSDVKKRLEFHNHLNPNSFTAKHRPWTLIKAVDVQSKSRACKIERYIKKRKSRIYIQRLINDETTMLDLLAKFPL